MRTVALAFGLALVAAPAVASDAGVPAADAPEAKSPEAKAKASKASAPTGEVEAGAIVVEEADGGPAQAAAKAEKREERRLQSLQQRRLACGCAMPRLLRKKEQEVTFDGVNGMAAWVRNDGTAMLEAFQLLEDGSLTPVKAPLVVEKMKLDGAGEPVPTAYELVRAYASAPGDAFYLGVRTPPRERPGDVLKAIPAEGGAPPIGMPALLDELWVGPVDHRETDRCGEFVSHRILTTPREDAPEVAGYLVTFKPTDGEPKTALVDERHARIFGLGRIEPCDHGVPIDLSDDVPQTAHLEVRTVSASFAVGPLWVWRISNLPGELPTPVFTPDEVSLDLDDNPFLVAPKDPVEGLLSDEKDHVAFGAMAFVLLGAGGFARILWAGRRRRGRHLADLACPLCEAEMSVDLEDPETDGMFCPKCGKSSVFVSFEADGTPKAHVMKLSPADVAPEASDSDDDERA